LLLVACTRVYEPTNAGLVHWDLTMLPQWAKERLLNQDADRVYADYKPERIRLAPNADAWWEDGSIIYVITCELYDDRNYYFLYALKTQEVDDDSKDG